MFNDLLLIENPAITPEQEKASEFVSYMLSRKKPIYNLMECNDESLVALPGYDDMLLNHEVLDVCKFFYPLPSIHENVSRVAIFSNASSIKYDPNGTRIVSSHIRVFAYGLGEWFHCLTYPDYGRTFVTVGHSDINSPEDLLGSIEKTEKSEMFLYLCDLLMHRCSQKEPESV